MAYSRIAIFVGLSIFTTLAFSHSKVKSIDCDAGQSLVKVLKKVRPGGVIRVSGTCYESIAITINVSIIGNNAIISGELQESPEDLITVSGASDVHITGLRVVHGNVGVVVTKGANLSLENVDITDNASNGILVSEKSYLKTSNVLVEKNKGNGVDIAESSSLSIVDKLTIRQNSGFGLNVGELSSVISQDAVIETTDNFAMGLHAVTASNIFLNDSSLDASRNFLRGVSINSGASLFAFNTSMTANDSTLLDGFAFANGIIDLDKDSSIVAEGNGRDGLVLEGATLTLFVFITDVGPSITVRNNKANGIRVVLGAKLELKNKSTLISENNAATGLLVDDGSSANLRGATISGNGENDMKVLYASRVNSVAGNTISNIMCDNTVIVKGEHACP